MKSSKQDHFLKLYEPVHNQFERFCRARVFGQMEFRDLMNETLMIAFRKLDQLKSDEAFLSWLFSISVRVLANQHRKIRESAIVDEQQLHSLVATNRTDSDAEVYLLHQALALLPDVQKEAIILFEISGFSVKEIAVMQAASESAVKQRLSRGRQRLTSMLTSVSAHQTGKEASNG